MSELSGQLLPAESDLLCGCGQLLRHVGMCSVRREKAVKTRARNRANRKAEPILPAVQPVQASIKYYHLAIEGDFIRVQLTGGSVEQLKESLVALGQSLGFSVEVN